MSEPTTGYRQDVATDNSCSEKATNPASPQEGTLKAAQTIMRDLTEFAVTLGEEDFPTSSQKFHPYIRISTRLIDMRVEFRAI